MMAGVLIDDLPGGLAGLEPLGRDGGRRAQKVLVGLVQLEQDVGDGRAPPGGGEALVPGVDVGVGDAVRHRPLAARQPLQRRAHLRVPAGDVGDDVLD